jgi:hypothetical protein
MSMSRRPILAALYASFCIGSLALAGLTAAAPAASAATSLSPGVAAASTASPASLVPHVLLLTPGSHEVMSGIGCRPRTPVMIIGSARYATGRVVAQGKSTLSGRFKITVKISYLGEPEADFSATCVNKAGDTIWPGRIGVGYVFPAKPVRIAPGGKLTVAAKDCEPHSPVLVGTEGQTASQTRPIATGTASAKGTFSIAVKMTIPDLGASGHVYGACYWNGNHPGGQDIDYSPYIPVQFTRS